MDEGPPSVAVETGVDAPGGWLGAFLIPATPDTIA
jgi:hypothetical protein